MPSARRKRCPALSISCLVSRASDSLTTSIRCCASRIRATRLRTSVRSDKKRSRVFWCSTKLRKHLWKDAASSAIRLRRSTMSGTISSAAALGVGARKSATKSQIVKSISCPIAETTGTLTSTITRATISSLNSHKSSMLPPPRATTIRSTGNQFSLGVASSRTATAISAAAPLPCTRTGLIRICSQGARRRKTFSRSRMAAPLGEVTIPIRRGNLGSARLRAGSKSPSASSLRLSASNFACNNPNPRGCKICTLTWYCPRASKTETLP